MLVHWPGRIGTQASSTLMETFAPVVAGGKYSGLENGTGDGVG
jgi:hypothetical protein